LITAHVNPAAEGLEVYEQENIGYSATRSGDLPPGETAWSDVTETCAACHHGFMGYWNTRSPGNSSGVCIRHPVAASIGNSAYNASEPIDGPSGSTDPEHWEGGSGIGFDGSAPGRLPFIVPGAENYANAIVVDADTNEVFCLTCHKAHGTQNENSMRWNYREGSNLGCQQCHNKGN
jgi:hypothetical protein